MKLGFIGCGVMANAMMGGIIKNGLLKPEEIWGADPFEGSRQKTKEQNGIHVTESNLEVIENCDVVFLTIKPQYYADAIASFRDHVREDQMFISIGAGRTLDYIAEQFENKPVKVVRVMPNTPAQVAEGMSAACPNQYVTEEETQTALTILRAFGKAELMPESLFDVVTGVSGSGPAYVCMFIEAMADAAVLGGIYLRRADRSGHCQDADGNRTAPGRPEGHGFFPCRHHHCGGPQAGRRGPAPRRDRGRERLHREVHPDAECEVVFPSFG